VFVPENNDSETLGNLNALKKSTGNKSVAANMLGMSRRHLYRKIMEYGLDIIND